MTELDRTDGAKGVLGSGAPTKDRIKSDRAARLVAIVPGHRLDAGEERRAILMFRKTALSAETTPITDTAALAPPCVQPHQTPGRLWTARGDEEDVAPFHLHLEIGQNLPHQVREAEIAGQTALPIEGILGRGLRPLVADVQAAGLGIPRPEADTGLQARIKLRPPAPIGPPIAAVNVACRPLIIRRIAPKIGGPDVAGPPAWIGWLDRMTKPPGKGWTGPEVHPGLAAPLLLLLQNMKGAASVIARAPTLLININVREVDRWDNDVVEFIFGLLTSSFQSLHLIYTTGAASHCAPIELDPTS